ncbi:MAG: serine/threonine protein kinase [Candidatus Promineifilaceae bacterium]
MARSDWIGETLNDRYEIIELLGQGGMSAVYKANDPNLRRVVAVKLIHSHLSKDPQFVRRFEEEAAAVAQLRHPNLIQVFDFNHDDDAYYIVFEFVPGETIQARLKRLRESNRQMDITTATRLIAQAADGLDYAHSKGLIHRDIKPANIMINVQNAPIVMDFGIAKIMGGTQHTATGAVLGTARYMSPEQIKGDQIDPRTDIYSLGVTLFEMLGGRPPFNADSAMTLMMMHVTDPVPDLRNLRGDIPAGLVAIVNKALAKDPDARYRTAAEFAAALRNPPADVRSDATIVESRPAPQPDPEKTVVEPALAAMPTGSTAAPGTGSVPTSAAPPADNRRWLYIAGGALALLLLLGGIWAAFLRDGGGSEPPAVAEVTEAAETAEPTEEPAAEATVAEVVVPEPTAAPTEAPTAEPSPLPEPTALSAGVNDSRGAVSITTNGQEAPLGPDSAVTAGSLVATGGDGQAVIGLPDGSLVELAPSTVLEIVELAPEPAQEVTENVLALVEGDFLLRQQEPGTVLTLLDGQDNLLGSLQALEAAALPAKPSHAAARRAAQDAADTAVMAVNLGSDTDNIRISCFAGLCTIGDSFTLPPGEEAVIDRTQRALLSQEPLTAASESYAFWQETCEACLPTLGEAVVEAPPTATIAAPTATTAAPTATTAPPTATLEAPTPTTEAPTATVEPPTAEPTATEVVQELFVRITNISLENGQYIVSYETVGYTEQLPGQHVHFYFDTVPESQAGVPGSGPWILYGGPRPFTQYGEGDRPGGATSMCARVANADHSIIYGSGNCYPLP